jgi:succinoglycan biosynthesis protein ExoA
MSRTPPLVTLIIPARPGQAEIQALAAAPRLDYPRDRLEILVARGRQPAQQRNVALRQARGELIYFLDDDSVPAADNLARAVPYFAGPEVQVVGGPNVCPPEAPAWEQAFALTMGSWLAFGPSRARYVPVGARRDSSEKELILCNLMARKTTLLALGGFDESLYPNEENALMDAIMAQGGRLLYDPDFRVFRRPRRDLRSFLKMLMAYGRGRAEQFRLHPTPGTALNFVPPAFCVYLAVAVALRGVALWPLAPYALLVLLQALALRNAPLGGRLRVLGLIPITHLGYGTGFWRGLFSPLRSATSGPPGPVEIQSVPTA